MVDALGLERVASLIYRSLVERSPRTLDELADDLGEKAGVTASHLDVLESRGMVSRMAGEPRRYAAAPPGIAVGALVLERQEAVRKAQVELEALSEAYRRSARANAITDIIDIVDGADAVRQRFIQMQAGATSQVKIVVRSAVAVLTPEDNHAAEDALARGVGYRVIVEGAVAERHGFLRAAEGAEARGAQVRVTSTPVSRMMVVDEKVALIPIGSGPENESGGALILYGAGLLAIASALFDRYWLASAPIGGTGQVLKGIDEIDAQVLRLLNAGLTDQKVAGQLGLSSRSIQRRMSRLMNRCEVATRLQLGAVAARRGWL